jgi:hypothetical protein
VREEMWLSLEKDERVEEEGVGREWWAAGGRVCIIASVRLEIPVI